METWNSSSTTVSRVNKPWAALMLLISLAGFLDATFLTIKHYQGEIPSCTLHGCETVLASRYAVAGPIPVALLGALYYLTIFLGTLFYIDTKKLLVARTVSWLTTFGLLATLYFLALQKFVIGAWCQYCLASALTSTLLFIAGQWFLRRKPTPPPAPAS